MKRMAVKEEYCIGYRFRDDAESVPDVHGVYSERL